MGIRNFMGLSASALLALLKAFACISSRSTIKRTAAFGVTLAVGLIAAVGSQAAEVIPGREILPVPAPEFKGKIGTNYKDLVPGFWARHAGHGAGGRAERASHRAR